MFVFLVLFLKMEKKNKIIKMGYNMFDIAYEHEATIEAAKIYKEKLCKILSSIDMSKPFNGFIECLEIERCNNCINYHSIMFNTHGV